MKRRALACIGFLLFVFFRSGIEAENQFFPDVSPETATVFPFGGLQPGMHPFLKTAKNDHDQETATLSPRAVNGPYIYSNGVSVPSDFPAVEVTVNDPACWSGKIFLNNWSDASPYLLIFNNDGTPYWYRKTPARQRDFKWQPNGLLTSRVIPSFENAPNGAFEGMDSSYAVVDTFYSGPGYGVDEHELQVLPNGHYLIVVLETLQDYDMSKVVEGGYAHANIGLSHFQELDENDQVISTWKTNDHFKFTDADPKLLNIRTNSFLFPHLNAIDVDDDSNLVISCRLLSEVSKINRKTGDFIWRLGGKNNQFTFLNDPLNGFSAQHAVRVLGNGHYILFDNGNGHEPPTSRAVEYALDTLAMTATLVWEYRQEPGTAYSYYMGNAQRLPNGNTLINWAVGSRSKATEITPDGKKVHEMNFVDHYDTYRTHKFDWDVPAKTPYLMIESGTTGATLLFNQFGDPDVDYYRIYHGIDLHPTTLLDTSRLTMKTFQNLENKQYHFFRITSVNKAGGESGYSNEDAVIIKTVDPGENQVLNGGFSDSDRFWGYGWYGDVLVGGSAADSVFHLSVGAPNNGLAYLFQYPIELLRNETYIFEFDAWSEKIMQIQPSVANNTGQTDYSRIGNIQIGPRHEHYSYEFTKKSSSTTEAIVLFFIEGSSGELYIDNVSLKQRITSGNEEEKPVHPFTFRLERNHPNPFNNETAFRFYMPETGEVTWALYDMLGRCVWKTREGLLQPGEHRITIHGETLGSGVYFCRVTVGPENKPLYDKVMKIVMIK